MTQILNSQSDAIVVVNLDKLPKVDSENVEEDVNTLNLVFCNSKSVKLFGFDMSGVQSSLEDKQMVFNLLNLP